MIVLLLFIFLNSQAGSEPDECLQWFQRAKIQFGKNCELDCATIPIDMASFSCNLRCPEFCKQKDVGNLCKPKLSWLKKIKLGRPPDWLLSSEDHSELRPSEREQIEKALNVLSDKFPVDSIVGIYKLDRSRNPFSRGTPSTYYKRQIVFYDSAFDDKYDIKTLLIHELGHHLHETDQRTLSRYKGRFSKLDEEDFATQFHKFIVTPEELKESNLDVHDWMHENFNKKYFLKECAR